MLIGVSDTPTDGAPEVAEAFVGAQALDDAPATIGSIIGRKQLPPWF